MIPDLRAVRGSAVARKGAAPPLGQRPAAETGTKVNVIFPRSGRSPRSRQVRSRVIYHRRPAYRDRVSIYR